MLIIKKSVFKNKNFVLLFLGQVVSNLGTQIFNFAMSIYIYDITDNNAIIAGIYFALGGIIFFLLTPFAGAIIDKIDKVKVVYITDFINGFSIVAAGAIIFTGVNNTVALIVLFATTIILAVNGALFNPAIRVLPAYMLDDEQQQQASSLVTGLFALYSIIGGIVGALLYSYVSVEFIFLFNGLSFIISAISEMFIRVSTKHKDEIIMTVKTIISDIVIGFKYLVKMKPIFHLLLMASVLNFFTTPVIVNGIPYLIKVDLVKDPIYIASMMSAFTVGVILMSVILGVRKQSEKASHLIIPGMIGMAFGFSLFVVVLVLFKGTLISFNLFVVLSMITFLIVGTFNGLINIPFDVSIRRKVDKEMMGRVFSVSSTLSSGLTPIAIALAGVVIASFGVMILFYIGAAAMILTALYTSLNPYIKQL